MRVSGHVPEGMNLRDAVEAGFEEIQHADYIFMNLADVPDLFEDLEAFYEDVARLTADPARVRELVELLVTHDVAVDPTLTILDSWSRVPHPWFDRMLERLPPRPDAASPPTRGSGSGRSTPSGTRSSTTCWTSSASCTRRVYRCYRGRT